MKHAKQESKDEKVSLAEFAHDLNNLLVGIMGSAQLLQDELSSHQRPLATKIIECANRASLLTERMLDKDSMIEPLLKQSESSLKINPLEKDLIEGKDTVLLIDDEEVVRSVSTAILVRAGYRVLAASNGPEGIRQFEESKDRIICVLLDLTMPYMRGNLVYARLKASDESVMVYLMSGYSDRQALHEFENHDILGFIQKPFQNEDILQSVAAARKLQSRTITMAVANH